MDFFKNLFFIFLLGFPGLVYSQCSNVGYTTAGGSSSSFSGHNECNPVTIASSGLVNYFAANFNGGHTGKFQMGLYTDVYGTPGQLVVQGAETSTASGWVTEAVPFTSVSAGSYWLAIMDNTGTDGLAYTANAVSLLYVAYSYSKPMPIFFSGNYTYAASVEFSTYVNVCPLNSNTATPTVQPTCAASFTPICSNQYSPTPTQTPYPAPINNLVSCPIIGYNNFIIPDASAVSLVAEANAAVTSGLASFAKGGFYIFVDDGWASAARVGGHLVADPTQYPLGLANFTSQIHALGLKTVIYFGAGVSQCLNDAPGSTGSETTDVSDAVSWGFDGVRFDNCTGSSGSVLWTYDEPMFAAMQTYAPNLLFQINNQGFFPWNYLLANDWGTTQDVYSAFASYTTNAIANVTSGYAQKPNAWNDPGIIWIGNADNTLTLTENKSQISLWAIMGSPLIYSLDMTAMSANNLAAITNEDVYSVDQDILGNCAVTVDGGQDGGKILSYAKLLAGSKRAAICFTNTDSSSQNATITFADIPGFSTGNYLVKDAWSGTSGKYTNSYTASSIPSHGSVLLIIEGIRRNFWQYLFHFD